MLVQNGVPDKYHYYYGKWLRYYLDFCLKYNVKQSNKGSLSQFLKKLKEKNQAEHQVKQAYHAMSVYYEIESTQYGK